MSDPTITYQASDLAGAKRREFIDAAKSGGARLRDTDGASLVMVPLGTFEVLKELRSWAGRYLQVEGALERPRPERKAVDFGELAWLSAFDDEDQASFRRELHEALVQAVAAESLEPVNTCVRDWRTTARALSDDTRRKILTGRPDLTEFVEVSRPK